MKKAEEHFGAFLQQLRDHRGWTQRQLAERSQRSEQTIQQAEAKEACTWSQRTAMQVLVALDDERPMLGDDLERYLKATGVTERAWARHKTVPAAPSGYRPLGPRIDGATVSLSPLARGRLREMLEQHRQTPESLAATAHRWLDHLIENAGTDMVINGLIVMADDWGQNLPPRIMPQDLDGARAVAKATDYGDAKVTEITPTNVPLKSAKGPTLQPNSAKIRTTGGGR
ncbi:MAG: helix-turn-helix domain-containing protein [Phycisphaerales bacterium]